MAGGQKIGDAYIDIDAKFDKLNKDLKTVNGNIDKSFKKTGGNLNRVFAGVGAAMGAAFAVDKIVNFTKEAVKLAGVAEGVSKAFDRLNDPQLLQDLTTATRGTVSELELMKASVNASNLGVPIKNLASLFEFATQRAADTGESVDYLVQSIVTGIGRKSPLILDNLGISAIALKEQLGGVGLEAASVGDIAEAVGKIASASMEEIGDTALTTAQETAKVNAEFENLTVTVGQQLTPAYNEMMKAGTDALSLIAFELNENISVTDKLLRLFAAGTGNMAAYAESVANAAISQAEATKKAEILASKQDALNVLVDKGIIKRKEARIANGELNESQRELLQTHYDLIVASQKETKAIEGSTEAKSNSITTHGEIADAIKAEKEALEGLVPWSAAYYKQLKKIEDLETRLKKPREKESVSSISSRGLPSVIGSNATPSDNSGFADMIGGAADTATDSVNKLSGAMLEAQTVAAGLEGGFGALGFAVIQSLGEANTAGEAFAQQMGNMVIQLLAQMAAAAIGNAIAAATGAAAFAGPLAPAVLPATIASMVGTTLGALAAIPAFARGGQSRGGMALVGERGPELVNLPSGAMVTPSHQMGSSLGYGGGNGSVMPVEIQGTLQGDNLYLASSRGQSNYKRWQ